MNEPTPEEPFNPEDFGRYMCPVCDAPFDTPGDKKRHMKEKHPR